MAIKSPGEKEQSKLQKGKASCRRAKQRQKQHGKQQRRQLIWRQILQTQVYFFRG